jgi:metallo-beta-lactamase family protein
LEKGYPLVMSISQVQIIFMGATESVTGSRFLVTSPSSKIIVDCGMFQGLAKDADKNRAGFDPILLTADAVVLTHAHLDHCGYLPVLVQSGFKKPIYCTEYTAKLAALVLHDSAHLQEEDARYASQRKGSHLEDSTPLYKTVDVDKTLQLFTPQALRTRVQLTSDTFVTFYPSGHILGASFIVLEIADKKILFTGDMGRDNHPLLSPPDAPPALGVHVVVTESTYGNREHEITPDAFADEINAGIARGGTILIPAFAIDRTEVILMALRELMDQKKIPIVPVYADSPMALAALNYYREAITANDPEIREGISAKWAHQDPFDAGKLRQMFTTDESKSLNDIDERSIIISASGMASGGRVVHHLANILPDPKNTVILVGFQAPGTRGSRLAQGALDVRIHGADIPVLAHVSQVESFSVHADGKELMHWLKGITSSPHAFIVHGEEEGQEAMRDRIKSELHWEATIPVTNEVYTI